MVKRTMFKTTVLSRFMDQNSLKTLESQYNANLYKESRSLKYRPSRHDEALYDDYLTGKVTKKDVAKIMGVRQGSVVHRFERIAFLRLTNPAL